MKISLCLHVVGEPERVVHSGWCPAAEREGTGAGQGEGEGQGASEHLCQPDLRAGAEDPGAAGQRAASTGTHGLGRSGRPGGSRHRGRIRPKPISGGPARL